jgi:hypothetical protein
MTHPRIHHTVQPDFRMSFNEWHEYIRDERFRQLFNNLKAKLIPVNKERDEAERYVESLENSKF